MTCFWLSNFVDICRRQHILDWLSFLFFQLNELFVTIKILTFSIFLRDAQTRTSLSLYNRCKVRIAVVINCCFYLSFGKRLTFWLYASAKFSHQKIVRNAMEFNVSGTKKTFKWSLKPIYICMKFIGIWFPPDGSIYALIATRVHLHAWFSLSIFL